MIVNYKIALAAVALGALAGHSALAGPVQDQPEVRLAQAQGQPPGDSTAPADQGPAQGPGMQRGRGGAGMMMGEDGMMDPEMMMRMKRMHGRMMGGMMGGGMGPGMMGGMGPMGMCPMMMMGGADRDLSAEQVRDILEGQIAWSGNKRLKVGTVEQKDEDSYVAEIVTVDDSLVQRLEVDRASGAMRPVE